MGGSADPSEGGSDVTGLRTNSLDEMVPAWADVDPLTIDTMETQRLLRRVGEEEAEAFRETARQASEEARRARNRTILNLAGPTAFKAFTGEAIDTGLEEELRLQREAEQRAREMEREATREAPLARTEATLEAQRLEQETEQANREARQEARQTERELLLDATEQFTQDTDFGSVEDTLGFFRDNPEQAGVSAVVEQAKTIPGVTEEAIGQAAERGRRERSDDAAGGTGTGGGEGDAALPSSIEETSQRIDELIEEEQERLQQGATNAQLRDLQEDIVRLKRHRDILEHRSANAPADSTTTPPPTDTSAAPDTSAVPESIRDTTRTDTTRTDTTRVDVSGGRGPGRTPQVVPPGDMTTGGSSAGGVSEPSSGDPPPVGEAAGRERRGRGVLADPENLTPERVPATADSLVQTAGRDGALRAVRSGLENGLLTREQANRLLDELGVE